LEVRAVANTAHSRFVYDHNRYSKIRESLAVSPNNREIGRCSQSMVNGLLLRGSTGVNESEVESIREAEGAIFI
jgi:hypothetical protein